MPGEIPNCYHHVPVPWLPSWEESFPSSTLILCLSFVRECITSSGRLHHGQGSGSQLRMHSKIMERAFENTGAGSHPDSYLIGLGQDSCTGHLKAHPPRGF